MRKVNASFRMSPKDFLEAMRDKLGCPSLEISMGISDAGITRGDRGEVLTPQVSEIALKVESAVEILAVSRFVAPVDKIDDAK